MNFKVVEEGFTEIVMDNGDRIKAKAVIGSILLDPKKAPDGSNAYQIQSQLVAFITPGDSR